MAATQPLLSLADVRRARERIGGRLHRTPMLGSRTLSELVGAEVVLKAELFQRTGSFKPRGVLSRLATLKAGRPVTVEPRSLADGLNAPHVGANGVAVCTALEVESVLVSEDALKAAF